MVGIGGDDEGVDIGFYAPPGAQYEVVKSEQVRNSQLSTGQLQQLTPYIGQTLRGSISASCYVDFAQANNCGATTSIRTRGVRVSLE